MHREVDLRRKQGARQVPIDDGQAVVGAEDTVKKYALVPQSGDIGGHGRCDLVKGVRGVRICGRRI